MAWGVPIIGATVTDATGNFALTEPAGVASGDVMIACIAYKGTAAITAPAGWTAPAALVQNTGNTDATDGIASGVMFYIVRGASAPSLTCTRTAGDTAFAKVISYSGGAALPFDVGSSATQGAAGATPTTATITTALDGELIVAMAAYGDQYTVTAFDAATDPTTASGATDTTTAPTNGTWIERSDSNTNTGADTGSGIADAIRSTAGATGTVQATISSALGRNVLMVAAFKLLPTAAITGTITASVTEADIVAGGKTLIITLTNDKWIAAGAGSFDLQRDEIIAGVTSAQSEALGWNLVPKVLQSVTDVVRTSDTVVTITWNAFATYNITATETITVTVPSTAVVSANSSIATPTFTVSNIVTTSVKTVDGLAQASVKTVDGLAIASVKTIDGLA